MSVAADGAIHWPAKYSLFGVGFSATHYEDAIEHLIAAARRRQSAVCTHMAVHALITAARDPVYREKINKFEIVSADGMPVRWALNFFERLDLPDRLYGPEMMIRLCRRATEVGVSVYFYGSTDTVVKSLCENMKRRFPNLKIAGTEAPPFRRLTEQEEIETIRRINDSGAGLVFIGLGCPLQDIFAHDHKEQIKAVQLCVGAAFDFWAGNKKMAPGWMQHYGLEWLYRLCQEPRRLWKRYLVTNSIFTFFCMRRLLLGR